MDGRRSDLQKGQSMNTVQLVGRIVRDPDITYTTKELCVAKYTLAISRAGMGGADYVNCTSFGKTGELIEKYVTKGDRIGLVGKVQTGSYEKDGKKVYVTNIIGERVEFLNNKNENNESNEPVAEEHPGFSKLTEEDIPF